MLVKRENIAEFIPQKSPFILIGNLLEVTEKGAVSSFTIPETHVLVENGYLSAAGLLENIAQTAAARSGYSAKINNQSPPIGFIGAMSKVKITALPSCNEEIETKIVDLAQALNMTLIEGTVFQNGNQIASCEMKIFLNPNIPQ